MVVGAAAVNGSRFFALGLGFVSIPLIARWLGPSEFGVYSASMASLAVITMVGGMGLFDGVRWIVARRGGTREAAMSKASKASRMVVAPIAVAASSAVFVMRRTGQLIADGILLIFGLIGFLATTCLDIAKSALWGRSSELPAELLVIFRLLLRPSSRCRSRVWPRRTGVFAAYVVANHRRRWILRIGSSGPNRPGHRGRASETEPPVRPDSPDPFQFPGWGVSVVRHPATAGGVLALGFFGITPLLESDRAALTSPRSLPRPAGVQLVLRCRPR